MSLLMSSVPMGACCLHGLLAGPHGWLQVLGSLGPAGEGIGIRHMSTSLPGCHHQQANQVEIAGREALADAGRCVIFCHNSKICRDPAAGL